MNIEKIFMSTQKELKQALYGVLKSAGYRPVKQDGFIFAQGTHPVMLVAHLDTVHHEPVKQICYSRDDNIMMSPQGIGGDDRCGVYMILEIIKEFKCSILFCEDEEMGAIGAGKFTTSGIAPKGINYIIEMDRKGLNDAVFYDCDNRDFTDFVLEAGFIKAEGSFSDISEIAPFLGIAAVNISSGYYNAHTQHEYVKLLEVENNIYRISKLIKTGSPQFEYIEREYKPLKLPCYEKYGLCEDLWYDSDELEEGYRELMLITDKMGYVIDKNGELNDYDDFCIDCNNKLYILDVDVMDGWEEYIAYETDGHHLSNYDGGIVRFNTKLAEQIFVSPFKYTN